MYLILRRLEAVMLALAPQEVTDKPPMKAVYAIDWQSNRV